VPRRGSRKLSPGEIEENLKSKLGAVWAHVVREGDAAFSRYGMGYAVVVVPRVVRGVVTKELVPAIARVNVETGFATNLVPVDPGVVDSIAELLKTAAREALIRTLSPKA